MILTNLLVHKAIPANMTGFIHYRGETYVWDYGVPVRRYGLATKDSNWIPYVRGTEIRGITSPYYT